jgi:protein-S-isoprenylcysteine O-methyltransferase Ste14
VYPDLQRYIAGVWIAVGIVWAIGATRTKRTARRQSVASRLVQGGLGLLAALLFTGRLQFAPLDVRFLPMSPALPYIGRILAITGAAFAIWARLFLGATWSGTVTVKADHELVRRGPTRSSGIPSIPAHRDRFRPGAAPAGRRPRNLALLLKMRLEEAFMTQQFGAQYLEYRRNVKALIPFVW